MNGTISLVQSRTFWAAAIALAAIVTKAFGLSQVTAALVDPSLVDNILNGIMMVSTLSTIVFRTAATTKVTSVLPAPK